MLREKLKALLDDSPQPSNYLRALRQQLLVVHDLQLQLQLVCLSTTLNLSLINLPLNQRSSNIYNLLRNALLLVRLRDLRCSESNNKEVIIMSLEQ